MTEQIKDILQKLQEATASLFPIKDMFQNQLNYFNEDDRRKISKFNETFDYKVQNVNAKIASFVRFVEKSFTPSPEDLLKIKALDKLHADFQDFDKWEPGVQNALIDREIKNFAISEPNKPAKETVKHPTTGSAVSVDNLEPNKAFPVTYNFEFCRPYAIEICGEKRNITSWRGALCEVADVLCSKNTNLLTIFIAQDVSKKPWFSLSPSVYRRPVEISKGIYTEANLNTHNMIKSCRKLLDIYAVDYNEVSIFLSKISSKGNVQD